MPLEVLGDEVLVRSVPGAETLSPADSAVPTSDMRNCVSDMREREPEDAQGPQAVPRPLDLGKEFAFWVAASLR